MKKIIVLILLFFIFLPAFASKYQVYTPDNYKNDFDKEKILFILDFSNSMTEYILGERKVDMMLNTIQHILPTIDKNKEIGLRVYGHRLGLTAFDGCRASSLIVPIERNNGEKIEYALSKTKPRGMTPITYSLKKAIDSDFVGFNGEKHIILLSDGGENCDESPCSWAIDLMQTRKDIKIDVIAFSIKKVDDLEQLKCTALVTKGHFYTANTAAELSKGITNSLNHRKNVDAKIIPNK
ncbi:MAG: VWA domain-containing protein [bacterium]|nr:VWA domain-containing protein [bacterium]